MRRVLMFLGLLWTMSVYAQDRQEYIATYRDIAIREMHRSGIPASIKLAQGILESNAGASMLAKKANNHFGIKCGMDWRGKSFMKTDDDRNGRGRLVKSCFRVFNSAEESFVAHTEFLMDPNKHYRYGFLFEIADYDYRSWARGLKRAGYATNPRYPELLIRIIEEYRLYELDQGADSHLAEKRTSKQRDVNAGREGKSLDNRSAPRRSYALLYQNGVQFVYARHGDTPKSLARDLDMPSARIVRLNETIDGKNWRLHEGERVYLQHKAGKYKGSQKYHIVGPGESLAVISQIYGIKTKSLAKRNGLSVDQVPAPGERLVLRGRNKNPVRLAPVQRPGPKVTDHEQRPAPPAAEPPVEEQDLRSDSMAIPTEGPEHPEPVIESVGGVMMLDPIEPRDNPAESIPEVGPNEMTPDPPNVQAGHQQQEISSPDDLRREQNEAQEVVATYIVQPQDTLYKIAREHGVSVADLKKLNNLETDNIHPGQQLKVSK